VTNAVAIFSMHTFEMRTYKTKIFSSAFLLLNLISVFSYSRNNLHYFKWHETISIYPDQNRFLSKIVCSGSTINESSSLYISYDELERIGSLKAIFKTQEGKFSTIDSSEVTNNAVSGNDFYEGLHEYKINMPSTSYFELSYSKSTDELMKLAALNLNPSFICDTAEYDITIPEGYRLLYKICNVDSTVSVSLDSVWENESLRYRIIALNKITEKTTEEMKMNYLLPSSVKIFPAIKTIVIPEQKEISVQKYFDSWFINVTSTVPELSKTNYKVISNEISMTKDTEIVIAKVFSYVKSKIKYLSIENGIAAYKPRDPNSILEDKQGDCKDMAFLIYSILKRYGIKSSLALAATLEHPFDWDFPSLASGNHMICAVKVKGNWIFLDATENICEFGFPSDPIQNKHVLIIDKDTSEYRLVPAVEASVNASSFNITFHVSNELAEGKFDYQFKHCSANNYKYMNQNMNNSNFILSISQVFKDLTNGGFHEDIVYTKSDSSINFHGAIKVKSGILSTFNNQTYLPIDFMPYLDWLPKAHKITHPVICYSTLNKKGNLILKFDHPIHLKNERAKRFDEKGFQFQIAISQPDPTTIAVSSDLMYNDVVIKQDALAAYRKMIVFINAELNKGIIYE
jgi:hypothetical protein